MIAGLIGTFPWKPVLLGVVLYAGLLAVLATLSSRYEGFLELPKRSAERVYVICYAVTRDTIPADTMVTDTALSALFGEFVRITVAEETVYVAPEGKPEWAEAVAHTDDRFCRVHDGRVRD